MIVRNYVTKLLLRKTCPRLIFYLLLLLLGDPEPSLLLPLLLPRLRRPSRSPELRLRVLPPDDARRLLPRSPLRLRGELSRRFRSLLRDFLLRSLLLLRDLRRLRCSALLLLDLLFRSLLWLRDL